jgi:hypothetical protein
MSVSLKFLLGCLLLLGIVGVAYAAPTPVDPSQFEGTASGFQHFYTYIAPFIKKIVTHSVITDFSLTLWKFFTVMMICWQLYLYVFKGAELIDFFNAIFLISIVHVLMVQFDLLTSALWSWSEGISSGIQISAIGVSDDFYAPRYIWNLITSFNWSAKNILLYPEQVAACVMLGIAGVILSVCSFFATVWAMWGYSLAKIIGLLFIPTLLFEPLSWLFDGWLRFFFGFLLFNIVAKATLMLVLIALAAFFHDSLGSVPQHMGYQYAFNSFADVLGIFVFLVLGIIALFSTGSFVRSIVSGSHTGSMGASKALQMGIQQMVNKIT